MDWHLFPAHSIKKKKNEWRNTVIFFPQMPFKNDVLLFAVNTYLVKSQSQPSAGVDQTKYRYTHCSSHKLLQLFKVICRARCVPYYGLPTHLFFFCPKSCIPSALSILYLRPPSQERLPFDQQVSSPDYTSQRWSHDIWVSPPHVCQIKRWWYRLLVAYTEIDFQLKMDDRYSATCLLTFQLQITDLILPMFFFLYICHIFPIFIISWMSGLGCIGQWF